MGTKKVLPDFVLNWGSSLNSNPYVPNTALSGVTAGAMASTNTIYTNVQDISNFDNIGLEVTYTGTPTGTISILVSITGNNFYALTFSPPLTQPTGAAGGYFINLNGLPARFLAVQYTNISGSGSLTVAVCQKDLN